MLLNLSAHAILQPALSSDRVTSALFTREDYKCRITQQPSRYLGEKLEAVSIVSPGLFHGVLNANENAMLLAFLGPDVLESLQELLNRIYNNETKDEEHPELQNMFLASRSMKEAFHKAHYAFFPYLKLCWKPKDLQGDQKAPNSVDPSRNIPMLMILTPKYGILPRQREPACRDKITSHYITFATPSTSLPLPHPLLLGIHSRLSKSRSWMDLAEQRARAHSNRNIIYSRICQWIRSAFTHLFKLFLYLASERLRIYCYRTISRLSSNLYAPQGIVQRVPGGMIVKRGPRVSSNEASALQLIAHNPFLPAPQPLDFVTDSKDGHSYLIMSHIPGQSFRSICDLMTDSDLSSFTHDLRTILTEMRKIHNPHGEARICGAKGNTPCHDFRLGDPCGPFPTLDSFHQHLRTNAYVPSLPSPSRPTTNLDARTQKCLLVHATSRSIFFTHGDLNLNNILINPSSFRISGLVDWECAGFYPDYWEKTKSLYSMPGE
ncbi:hypothetical protein BTUL_0047g00670 [Botrytis tulipae]|uniref:Aminoglycoside phosphotransferase domain-containing protein n=1 Tax=Botrytis tulipae TaxID=87230 RepID=A0A4Z1ERP9_9HELO|nr:hypothetical protein BTUL_0047g00670 [Botrytis tulipae]